MKSSARCLVASLLHIGLWCTAWSDCSVCPTRRDCGDIPASSATGIHLVRPAMDRAIAVYCDMDPEDGKWLVIQRRFHSKPQLSFNRGWDDYKWGFGSLDYEFWLGNEYVWRITSGLDRQYELRIDMHDFEDEHWHAVYKGFKLSSEADGYRLTVGAYSGNAGDSLSYHCGQKFSTHDADNDASISNCAAKLKGGWWFKDCRASHLNGLFDEGGSQSEKEERIYWDAWKGHKFFLKRVEMKIRPMENVIDL